jgi:hypothetical protein
VGFHHLIEMFRPMMSRWQVVVKTSRLTSRLTVFHRLTAFHDAEPVLAWSLASYNGSQKRHSGL